MATPNVKKKKLMPDTPAPPGSHWMVGANGKPYLMKGSSHSKTSSKARKKIRNQSAY